MCVSLSLDETFDHKGKQEGWCNQSLSGHVSLLSHFVQTDMKGWTNYCTLQREQMDSYYGSVRRLEDVLVGGGGVSVSMCVVLQWKADIETMLSWLFCFFWLWAVKLSWTWTSAARMKFLYALPNVCDRAETFRQFICELMVKNNSVASIDRFMNNLNTFSNKNVPVQASEMWKLSAFLSFISL